MSKLNVAYISGSAAKVNEKVIDDQWTQYLGEHVNLIGIPPFRFFKLFGGSLKKWVDHFPSGLEQSAHELEQLCERFKLDAIYINVPLLTPYLMLCRNVKKLNVTFISIAHSVASPYWLKHWLAVAPWVTNKDIILSSTHSCKDALLNISRKYETVRYLPLCIRHDALNDKKAAKNENMIFSIGRIQVVKNIHVLLESFDLIRKAVPNATLVIAGEYTGNNEQEIAHYQQRIQDAILHYGLEQAVHFTGPITGEEKKYWFNKAKILVNLSTDPGETFGFNLLEAKTIGLPVVCSNWNGFKELVLHGKDGLRVPCSWEGSMPTVNKEHVANACLKLMEDDELYKTISQTAMERAKDYDDQNVMPQLVSMIENAQQTGIEAHADEDVVNVARTSIAQGEDIYEMQKVKHMMMVHDIPLQRLLEDEQVHDESWMKMVKPIISHFAGGEHVG
ncbi:glycosyltransferase family 4 protein [Longirhabdus pacifica]|uniref:glycosyltransferase family 4 protein n=1 Tax=Longirhabdus pacifica TaxID=2305227 RepID=UPI0010091040|nr:glycosyltransferase family 4 protein [Longirhabdus pacifica]